MQRILAVVSILAASMVVPAGPARAETVAFVAPGESPSRAARRAVLRSHEVLGDRDDVTLLRSQELRRALAGLPATGPGDDPLADVRQLVREAGGDGGSDALQQLGHRLEVDLLITVRHAGEELEYRGFNVELGAYYRGTLMLPALAAPDEEELLGFVLPRARAVAPARAEGAAETEEERPERRSIWSRWWVWVIIGGVVVAAAVVGYVATPNQVEDTGVTLNVVVP